MRTVVGLCLALALGAILALPGCGGASGEKPLEGTWFGPAFGGGSRAITFGGGGEVLNYWKNGNPLGVTGRIVRIDGAYYDLYLDDGSEGRFLLAEDGHHAAMYFKNDDLVALQQDENTWSAEPFDATDVAPGTYDGATWFISAGGGIVDQTWSYATIDDTGAFDGYDDYDRMFASPPATTIALIDPVEGVFNGPYMDQFRDTDADLTLLMTPDKLFVVAFANWAPWKINDGWVATWMKAPPEEVPAEPLPPLNR